MDSEGAKIQKNMKNGETYAVKWKDAMSLAAQTAAAITVIAALL